MSTHPTQDLTHDLRDVADDLKGIVETVVVPRVSTAVQSAGPLLGSAVHAAADRVPSSVVDRLPDRVSDHFPTQKRHRGRKLLLLGGLAALGAAAAAYVRRSQASTPTPPAYPRPVDDLGVNTAPTDAAPPEAVGPLDPSDPRSGGVQDR